MGSERFLSTENDLRLTVIYVACLVLLIFGGEALAGTRTPMGSTGTTPVTPNKPSSMVFEERTLLTQSGTTAEGQTTTVEFTVNTSAQWLEASLSWTDDLGNNDDFGLSITVNGREVASEHSTSGKVTALADPGENATYNGSFNVQIRAINCPGMVSASPVDRDSGNSWSLTVVGSVQVKK